jgi:hypothetical protein
LLYLSYYLRAILWAISATWDFSREKILWGVSVALVAAVIAAVMRYRNEHKWGSDVFKTAVFAAILSPCLIFGCAVIINLMRYPAEHEVLLMKADPYKGPFGPSFTVELLQTLSDIPTPCLLKVTGPIRDEMVSAIVWIARNGATDRGPICDVKQDNSPANADDPQIARRAGPGITFHWSASFEPGGKIAHLFDADGFNISTSHKTLPQDDPRLVWIDIGPGSPWKSF